MMRLLSAVIVLLQSTSSLAFSPIITRKLAVRRGISIEALKDDINDSVTNRRELFNKVALTTAAVTASTFITPGTTKTTNAVEVKKVVVAGSTGQTGRRVLERLANQGGLEVVGGVRNVDKATKSLSETSTVVRGAMVQKVSSIDTSSVQLKHLDVVMDSVDQIAETISGADSLVIALGFIPGNPFKMNDEAHKVDNIGTCKLIDAAKKANIKKVVMVSSILTDARTWGKEKSPGFTITNAFGQVLDEKIIAEKYLRSSGLDYTIVRPGGLKAKPPTGGLIVSGENTLDSGEISRDLVADVCVASLTDGKASNKVLEIIEAEEGGPKVFNGLNM